MTKKSKSVQVRLTESEWKWLKQMSDNPSDYLRDIFLRRLHKTLAVKLVYTANSPQDVSSFIIGSFERKFRYMAPTLTLVSVKTNKKQTVVTWSGSVNKMVLPELKQLCENPQSLGVFPNTGATCKLYYRKESL